MGYMHYARRAESLPQDKFKRFAEDVRKVIAFASRAAFPVSVCFEYDQPNDPPEITEEVVRFNGKGLDGHETFYFPREESLADYEREEYENRDPTDKLKGKTFSSCKTARKPYDVVVTAALIIAKHHFGDDVIISSDGSNSDWINGRALCDSVLKYGYDYRFQHGDLEHVPDAVKATAK